MSPHRKVRHSRSGDRAIGAAEAHERGADPQEGAGPGQGTDCSAGQAGDTHDAHAEQPTAGGDATQHRRRCESGGDARIGQARDDEDEAPGKVRGGDVHLG